MKNIKRVDNGRTIHKLPNTNIVNSTYHLLDLRPSSKYSWGDIILLRNDSPMTKEYQLDISLKEATEGTDVFSESYRIALWEDFVNGKVAKEHNLVNHIQGFLIQLKKNSQPLLKRPLKKWSIVNVAYGMGVGSEILSDRPSIVYKSDDAMGGEDIITIPLTSALRDKNVDAFDRLVPRDEKNNLYQTSLARLRQARSISIKRLGKEIGVITDPAVRESIDAGMKEMLGLT